MLGSSQPPTEGWKMRFRKMSRIQGRSYLSRIQAGLETTLFQIERRDPIEGICQELKVLVAQLCPTLCNHMEYSPPGSSVQGILQANILKWAAISSSRGNYHTIALISQASKVMLKILQAQASTVCEPRTFRCSNWIQKRQRNQKSLPTCIGSQKKQENSRKTLFLLH